jgi:hypothetical protein
VPYAPYARIMKKIAGRSRSTSPRPRRPDDTRHRRAARVVQEAPTAGGGPLDAVPRQPDPARGRSDVRLADQAQGNEEARSSSRRLRPADLGAGADGPRSKAASGTRGREATEPDWDEPSTSSPATGRRRPSGWSRGGDREENAWVTRGARGRRIYEVFRRGAQGQASRHAGSVEAPNEVSPRRTHASSVRGAASDRTLGRPARGGTTTTSQTSYRRTTTASTGIRPRKTREGTNAQTLLELVDDELILGWRNSEWTGTPRC